MTRSLVFSITLLAFACPAAGCSWPDDGLADFGDICAGFLSLD